MSYNEAISILELNEKFTEQELKHAYRKSSKENHPDIHGEETEEKMKAINAAYELLKSYVGKEVSYEKKEEPKKEEKKVNPYDKEIREFAKKLEICYEDVFYYYKIYKSAYSFEGSLIEFFNYIINTFYIHKDEIFELYNQIEKFNGDLFYIINQYKERNQNENITIIEWLTRLVKASTLAKLLSVAPSELKELYIEDVSLGYDKTIDEYMDKIEETILSEEKSAKQFKNILNDYKKENEDKHKDKETFIDYLGYRALLMHLNTDSEGLIFKLFKTVREEDKNISIDEYFRALLGEFDNEKTYSKK